MEFKRVVVTGLGAITPIGNNVQDYWNNLINGVSGADLITRFDASEFKTKFACEIKNYDPLDHFDRKEARKLDLFTQFAMVCTDEAVKNANLNFETLNSDRIGVIWGAGIGGLDTFTQEIKTYAQGGGIPKFNPFFIPKMIANIAGGHIAIKYKAKGPNYTTVSACASSGHAILDAVNYIRLGKADIFITGGSEAAVNEAGVAGFNSMHALSVRNDDPKTASRPFDVDRDGFVIGEGGGCLIIEEYKHAIKRGAKIYAEIAGGGMNCDAHHITAPEPSGEGATKVMQLALEDAQMQPEDIDYINVHGTSTGLGDLAEPQAIINAFKEHAYKLSISSSKSMTGHQLGAAGAIESIVSILAIKNGIIPPTINQFNFDPQIDNKLDFTFNKAKKRDIKTALSNNFGFGGHNVSSIFKKIS